MKTAEFTIDWIVREMGEDRGFLETICANEYNFLLGKVETVRNGTDETLILDEEAIEELKERVGEIKSEPGGIPGFMSRRTNEAS